ncbi:hypothetical protein B9Z55_000710 [Caenorhabditis nigoni]|uniref:Secreted protein n=1 Tax=Caenorhabditis nigoni TaxID=1611254 RepID=A0A2G5VUF0_9PELO|nr:hypothetical protein B9Z55_000710 [Caenorhabditis nigoni]
MVLWGWLRLAVSSRYVILGSSSSALEVSSLRSTREPTSYAPSSQQESKMKKGSKAVKTIKIREITENCKSLLFPNSEIAMLPGSICR